MRGGHEILRRERERGKEEGRGRERERARRERGKEGKKKGIQQEIVSEEIPSLFFYFTKRFHPFSIKLNT